MKSMRAIPLQSASFYYKLLLLAILTISFSVHSDDVSEGIIDLVNNGELQRADILTRQQLSNSQITIDDKISYLAILGDIKFYNRSYIEAIELYQRAKNSAEKNLDLKQVAEQYKNIALSYAELSEYSEALFWHQKALEILKNNNWLESEINLSISLSLSSIYGYIGAYEQSMETITSAQKLSSKLNKFDALSNSYVRMAAIHLENNNHIAAINSLKLVDTLQMNDRSSLAWYYSLYSASLIKLDQSTQAQQIIEKALNSDVYWTSDNINTFEIILLESYLQEEDIDQVNQSFNQLRKDKSRFNSSWLLHYLLAKKYKLENKHKLSFTTNISAISLFFKYASWNHHSNNSLFFEIPQGLVNATIEDAMIIGLANSDLIFELFYLAFLAKQPIQVKVGKDSSYNNTNKNLIESAVINDIMFGEASLNFSDRLKASEIQAGLKPTEGFVFYLSIDNKYYAMLVTYTTLISTQLPSNTNEVNNFVVQLISQLETHDKDWIKTAHELDDILIKPLRTLGLESLKTVHFIQDNNLRFLPMDVLIDDQGVLLSDRHEIAINTVKSLKAYLKSTRETINQENNTQLNLVGISEGKLQIPSYWVTAYRNLNLNENNLQHVNMELKQLNAKFSNTTLTMGKDATETHAKKIISDANGILHFASHGFDNAIAPAYSALVLKSDNINDGLLQAREISNLNTKAELVVLASCSSARGGLSGLYGYNSGLAESFLFAGAKSVIGTLWDVKDQKTYQFMQWFYQGLNHDLTVSKALNFAKKQARQSGWNTYDWAAFVLLGQTHLKLTLIKKDNPGYAIILTVLLLAFLFSVVFIFFMHKNKIKKTNKYNLHQNHN
jgi:CHAT domain-containing protein